jgi:RHS repeat-associated protein
LVQSVTNTAAGTSSTYTYDADGTLLLQSDPAAAQKLLYLPWGEQITLTTSTNAVSGLRTIAQSPDGVTVVHASTGAVTYELADPHGTASAEVSAADLSYRLRYFDPFGQQRGTAPAAWPDQRAYLDQPNDPSTGLDLLGARQYDPATGRFLSIDPLLESGDQRQMNGYSYSADDPINGSDPQGLYYIADAPGGGGSGMQEGSSGEHSKSGGSSGGSTISEGGESGGVWHGGGSSGGGYSRTGFAPHSGGAPDTGRRDTLKPASPAALFGVKGSCSQGAWQAPCLPTHRSDTATPMPVRYVCPGGGPSHGGCVTVRDTGDGGENPVLKWFKDQHEDPTFLMGVGKFFDLYSTVTGGIAAGAATIAAVAPESPTAEPAEAIADLMSDESRLGAGAAAVSYAGAWVWSGFRDGEAKHEATRAVLSYLVATSLGPAGGVDVAMAKMAPEMGESMRSAVETQLHFTFDVVNWLTK